MKSELEENTHSWHNILQETTPPCWLRKTTDRVTNAKYIYTEGL